MRVTIYCDGDIEKKKMSLPGALCSGALAGLL